MIAVVSSPGGNWVFFISVISSKYICLKRCAIIKVLKQHARWLSETLSVNILPYICRTNRALRVGVKVRYF